MAFGWDDAALVAFLLLDAGYHRLTQDDPPPKKPDALQVPSTSPGDPISLIYGRVRVKAPFLVWWGNQATEAVTSPTDDSVQIGFTYFADMFFIIGMPFYDGKCTLGDGNVGTIWYGDVAIPVLTFTGLASTPLGYYGIAGPASLGGPGQGGEVGGELEFYGGKSDQDISTGQTPVRLVAGGENATLIPDFRGFAICMFCAFGGAGWSHGESASLAAYQFEIRSYPSDAAVATIGVSGNVGDEANPIHCLYDIAVGQLGRLGMDPSRINVASFRTAAMTCLAEGNGYSREIVDGSAAGDVWQEIMRQIDGTSYWKPEDGQLYVKLIRGDWNPADVLELAPDNGCEDITNVVVGGWPGTTRLLVKFSDRANGYNTNSVEGMADATAAAGQADGVGEQTIEFPGCCTEILAQQLADREVAQRFRPITKCTAICDQRFAGVNRGDVVAVTWPDNNWNRVYFRVGDKTLGAPGSNKVELTLILEFFQAYRGVVGGNPTLPAFPGGGLAG